MSEAERRKSREERARKTGRVSVEIMKAGET